MAKSSMHARMIAASVAAHVSVVTMKLAALVVTTFACVHQQGEPPGSTRMPAPVTMEQTAALGTWRSSWGALVLEPSPDGKIVGRWSYTRAGEQHAGNLEGTFDGNVLRFAWRASSPTTGPALGGDGWIAFDPREARFRGEWWTPPFKRMTPAGDGRSWYREGHRLAGFVTGVR